VSTPSISGIVLAGGRSTRFGAAKLDADLAGRSVLDRTIEAIGAACTEVVVVGRPPPGISGPTEATRYLEDRVPFEGPLVGLHAGLAHAAHDLVVVVAGDMPFVRGEVLRALLERIARPSVRDAAVLVDHGEARPLPMALRRLPALDAAEQAIGGGERSLRQLLARLRVETIAEPSWRRLDASAASLIDIDSPEDLDRARARFSR
jgi:molybdopterin-guanine dinucleotide biosynthesis protein A